MRSTRKIIENSVLNYLCKYNIKKGSKIIAAFSGGPDSTVLLTVLSGLTDYPLHITAAYFNHGLRAESELDEEEGIIRSHAEKLGVEIFIDSAEPGALKQIAVENRLSLEEAARNARYDFLYKTMHSLGAQYIATGHNLNDNSETVLMRFLQNAGISGLSGIPVKSENIIRPLCEVNRLLIEQYIAEEELIFSNDKTNSENEFLRNKLRHDIIPVIKRVFPEFDHNMSGFSEKMKKYNDFIETEADCRMIWIPDGTGWKIPVEDFYKEHEILRIKSLYKILNMVSSSRRIRYGAVEQAACGRIPQNGKILLSLSDAEVFARNDFIFVDRLVNRDKNSYLLDLEAGIRNYACGQSFILIESSDFEDTVDYSGELYLKLLTDYPLIVRSCREGDSIETEAGRKSLKKIFTEWKIKSEDKYRVPVVENSSRILAVVGKHLGYDNKLAPIKQNADGSLIKILLVINSDTETIGE